MKAFEVIYGMGGIATGGYFKSVVVAHKKENVNGLLNEQHDENVLVTIVEEKDIDTSDCVYEQVLSTDFA